jgi:hypothetical protein
MIRFPSGKCGSEFRKKRKNSNHFHVILSRRTPAFGRHSGSRGLFTALSSASRKNGFARDVFAENHRKPERLLHSNFSLDEAVSHLGVVPGGTQFFSFRSSQH